MSDDLTPAPLFSMQDETVEKLDKTAPKKAKKAAAPLAEEYRNIPGSDLLSDEEVEKLREEAAAKARKTRKEQASKELAARFEKEENHRIDPSEELMSYTVDLPGFADRIMLDGVVYMHGVTYRFPKRQYDTIRDLVSHAWRHESETGGANRDAYRGPRSMSLRPGAEGLTTSQLLRV